MASFKITTVCCQSFWFYSSLWWKRTVCFGKLIQLKEPFVFNIFYLQYNIINMFWLLEKIESISVLCVCVCVFYTFLLLGFCCVLRLHDSSFPLPGYGYRCSGSACCMLRTSVPFIQKTQPLQEEMLQCLHLEVVSGLLSPPVFMMCQNCGFSHQYHFGGWTVNMRSSDTLNNWHISWDTWQTNLGGKNLLHHFIETHYY